MPADAATTNDAQQPEFGYWRGMLWPVHRHELSRVFTLWAMFMFITFNYTLLRNTKDALVVTAAGAEIIPFLKVWCTLPGAIIYMAMYSKASNVLSKKGLFRASILPFILYFAAFGWYIYPNRDSLTPNSSADYLQKYLPKAFVAMWRFWSFSLFYSLSELWGTVVLSVMFWGLANDITPVTQSKRIYAMLGIGGNFALIFSGPAINLLTDLSKNAADPWELQLKYLCSFITFGSFAILGLHWYLWNRVISTEQLSEPLLTSDSKPKKKKANMGFFEGMVFLAKDKYIMCIATLVIAYGIAINLVEVTWKNQLKHHYPNPSDYVTFMGYFSSGTGLLTVLMMMFVGGNMVRRMGWQFTAQFTPWMLLITGAIFFVLVLVKGAIGGGEAFVAAAVYVGAVQNILSKSSKYSLFDPTKEMSYIPLDDERKVKGKAAIDGVGSRLGKSGGSIIYQVLLVIGGSLDNVTPYVAAILAAVVGGWIVAAATLGRLYEELTRNSMKS